jgi:hypothetical protein
VYCRVSWLATCFYTRERVTEIIVCGLHGKYQTRSKPGWACSNPWVKTATIVFRSRSERLHSRVFGLGAR